MTTATESPPETPPAPTAPAVPAPKRERVPAVDILRGGVMAVMALDHVRDYFFHTKLNWMDPAETRADLFVTRWAAQFCAPAFFLLAGLGASLSLAGGKPPATVARFLFVRGLFLILLDLTVVRVAWDFNFDYSGGLWFIVLGALGVSMIVVAGLVRLPWWCAVVVSVAAVGGANAFDGESAEAWGSFEPVWVALRVGGSGTVGGVPFYVTYTLVPWVGVMALGYAIGPVLGWPRPRRRRALLGLGLALFGTFAVLRAFNLYGDPRPWLPDSDHPLTWLAFLRTKKYPASLQHILMFVGLLLLLLAAIDREKPPGPFGRWLVQFGRAPLFFYVLHLYVIHTFAVLFGWAQGFPPAEMCVLYTRLPVGYGLELPGLYGVWVVVLAVCYPACVWFDGVKRRSNSVWLSYL